MKTMIFPPEARPVLYVKLRSSEQEIKCNIVEIDTHKIILLSSDTLALSGKIKFKDQEIDFNKTEEVQIENKYYSEIKIKADDLFGLKVHFLARQSVEDLTHWLMDAGEREKNKKKDEENSPNNNRPNPVEEILEPAPPKGRSLPL